MFDWVADGIRYLGWIIYVGMNYFISSIYQVLVSIPNNLKDIFNNEIVNHLFNATRNLFLIFVGLMIVIVVISRMFDWNVNKMLGQIKKIFLLCLILMALPWIFNQTLTITNNFITSSNNLMISEQNESDEPNLGVNLANIYIYKNEAYKSSAEYNEVSDDPFSEQKDITNGEILNKKIKDADGKEVYVYSYLNSILGLIMNLAFIILLTLTTFKVYGYLYNIIVIKIWIPIKMIYDGLNENPVSESIYEIISAFTSFAIQLVIIPFSVIMLNVFSSQVDDNIFLQIVSVLVALWFMFTGVDYIQSKFQGTSGVPTVLEAYSYAKLLEMGTSGIKGISSKENGNNIENISQTNSDDYINTGRENDGDMANQETDNSSNLFGSDPSSSEENVNNSVFDDKGAVGNINSSDENTINENADNDEIIQTCEDIAVNEDNIIASGDENLNNDEINNINEENNMGGNRQGEVASNINGQETLSPHTGSMASVTATNDNLGEIKETEINNNSASDDDTSTIVNQGNTGVINDGLKADGYVGDISENDNIKYPATDKQISYARSLGINPEGKDKYELGQEIENIKSGNQNNYTEPTWDKVEINEDEVVSVEELESMLNEGIKDD